MDINLPTYVAVPLAFILLCGIVVAYLIFTQVYVAINTKKAPDHESENFFKASDGFVAAEDGPHCNLGAITHY